MFSDYFFHLRCDIMNWIILHALNHCYPYPIVVYKILQKVHPERIKAMMGSLEKTKKEG